MYSMLVRTAEEAVLPFCREHGIGVIVHSPLAKGLLTGKYTADHRFPREDERSRMAGFQGERFASSLTAVAGLKAWAEEMGHSLVDLAIAWVLSNDAVTSAIVGAKTPDQVRQNAKAADWVLTPEELKEIDRIQGDFRILNLHH
jgi:aryl-alcohol dehydrogenase-like predicted oxidoreductase